jgi:DNA-directed RNA polymerase specialized sigma24 family protein
MYRESTITSENFEKMLSWLSQDRDEAGRKYEEIRRNLIEIFIWRGCGEAEDMADEVVNRVITKVEEILLKYNGDPALYFYGVAKKLLMEHQRWQKRHGSLPETLQLPTETNQNEMVEIVHDCLARCIQKLRPDDSELILQYYSGERQAKIRNRRGIALKVGIASNALRVRIHRIRVTLEGCIKSCLRTQNVQ